MGIPARMPATMGATINARELLLEELTSRCRKNPKYSLRAFSRFMGVTPAALSMILSGKRRVSRPMRQKMVEKLGFEPELATALLSDKTNDSRPISMQEFSRLSLDQFAIIADWTHFAVLSLIETKGFKPNIPWIASRLRISFSEAKSAVERLVRMDVLDTSSDPWKQIGAPILVENTISTAATKTHQRQILEKAMESLESDPIQLRDMSSMTIAIDPKLIPLAREEIKKFRVRLMNLLEDKGNASEVYHLAMQIYPVSETKGN